MPYANDNLWPEFVPIWKRLADLGAGEMLLIAGGYGLFLKQQWLSKNLDVATVTALDRWIDPAPRATSDMDFLLGLEFIAHEETNPEVLRLLKERGFEETGNPRGKRWQFVKAISEEKDILVELHAPTPGPEYEDLKAGEIRVSRKRSLGEAGINARHNQEAEGAEMLPFSFSLEGVPLTVPNPVAWTVMKLTAMADFWEKASSPGGLPDDRTKARKQAEKHARDVCRSVAMMTEHERGNSERILENIRQSESFRKACEIYKRAFHTDGWALELVRDQWQDEDFDVIRDLLDSWYGPED